MRFLRKRYVRFMCGLLALYASEAVAVGTRGTAAIWASLKEHWLGVWARFFLLIRPV